MAQSAFKPASEYLKKAEKALPWLAGVGIATGQIMASTQCTVPQQGSCSGCGSCVVAVGSLVTWSVFKNKQKKEFYIASSK